MTLWVEIRVLRCLVFILLVCDSIFIVPMASDVFVVRLRNVLRKRRLAVRRRCSRQMTVLVLDGVLCGARKLAVCVDMLSDSDVTLGALTRARLCNVWDGYLMIS